MTRKTLFTKNDQPFTRVSVTGPNGAFAMEIARAIREFKWRLHEQKFTTHEDVVREFMNADYHDGEGIFSFPRNPQPADTAVLCGGHAHGIIIRGITDRLVIETMEYKGEVSTRHYYRIAGLNVATGMWEFHHESLT